MCAIAGFSGKFDPELLRRMNSLMVHRGPDDEGTLHLDNVDIGLAHRRLSIIDLTDLGHQPMCDFSRQAIIVFNGEIYNFRELRLELERKGYSFTSNSDTEVLLNLYLAEGPNMLSRLNGIFAFALWDMARGQMLIARDGFGVKPLYYAETSKGFVFASELKALLAEDSISRAIDAQAVSNYLTYLWCPHPRTMLRDVRKLAPGGALIVKQGRIIKEWSYYDLPYKNEKLVVTPERAAEEVRLLLKQAVSRQMVSDVPVGAFLSGGLDSSSIVHFAREHTQGTPLPCFTIGFQSKAWKSEGMTDDLPYARRVATHLGVELNVVNVGPEMVQKFSEMVFQLDEPQADPAALNQLFISKLSREMGIKVLLSGSGGDDIFSGYRRHAALGLESIWSWLPRASRSALKTIANSRLSVSSGGRRFGKLLAYADLEDEDRLVSYFKWIDPVLRDSLLSESTKSRLPSGMVEDPLKLTLKKLPEGLARLDQMLYLEAKHFLADHNLNYGDKMSMAVGVEARVPFLDPDLVAYAISLPCDFKQRGLEGKWILKKAMEPFLPRDVIYRPKTGFGVPIRHWLRNELRPMVQELLSEKVISERGLFNPVGVNQLLEQHEGGRIDAAYPIMALMCVELWCRRFLDTSHSSK